MSNIYIQEPPTNGKVLLTTTVGDIDVELWSKEAPKACRNFVQLCMEGYYNDTIFHRLVPEFIVQGGDPTGTGHGGESIYGKPFRDELHSRLRFVRRGLVAMANSGPNDNGSQFFFTLGQTQELNNKHTIFGKVGGNTIYNMIRLSETDTDKNERPTHPHKILKARVLGNPFDDIEPRVIEKHRDEGDGKKKKSKSKATKNFSLLSFGEEAEEDELETNQVSQTMRQRGKSSHDLLDDSHLSSVPAVESLSPPKPNRKRSREGTYESDEDEEDVSDNAAELAVMEEIKNKLKKNKDIYPVPEKYVDEKVKSQEKLEELRRETKKLKRELQAPKGKVHEDSEPVKEANEQSTDNDVVAAFKAERLKYKEIKKTQGKKGSSREEATLALLAKFTSHVNSAREKAEAESPTKDEKQSSDEEEMNDDNLAWLGHTLHFEDQSKRVIDANVQDSDRYEIYDPRNPLNQRRREASKQTMKGRDKR